jgi:hypothetical protein
VRGFLPGRDQSPQLFFVVDYTGPISVEGGIGFGLTLTTDHITLKLNQNGDINEPNGFFSANRL